MTASTPRYDVLGHFGSTDDEAKPITHEALTAAEALSRLLSYGLSREALAYQSPKGSAALLPDEGDTFWYEVPFGQIEVSALPAGEASLRAEQEAARRYEASEQGQRDLAYDAERTGSASDELRTPESRAATERLREQRAAGQALAEAKIAEREACEAARRLRAADEAYKALIALGARKLTHYWRLADQPGAPLPEGRKGHPEQAERGTFRLPHAEPSERREGLSLSEAVRELQRRGATSPYDGGRLTTGEARQRLAGLAPGGFETFISPRGQEVIQREPQARPGQREGERLAASDAEYLAGVAEQVAPGEVVTDGQAYSPSWRALPGGEQAWQAWGFAGQADGAPETEEALTLQEAYAEALEEACERLGLYWDEGLLRRAEASEEPSGCPGCGTTDSGRFQGESGVCADCLEEAEAEAAAHATLGYFITVDGAFENEEPLPLEAAAARAERLKRAEPHALIALTLALGESGFTVGVPSTEVERAAEGIRRARAGRASLPPSVRAYKVPLSVWVVAEGPREAEAFVEETLAEDVMAFENVSGVESAGAAEE